MKLLKNKKKFPPQHQEERPGLEFLMRPVPMSMDNTYKPAEKLKGKVAIITGGDSGIGKAVALSFALEKAKIVIVYFNEHEDAATTKKLIEKNAQNVFLFRATLL